MFANLSNVRLASLVAADEFSDPAYLIGYAIGQLVFWGIVIGVIVVIVKACSGSSRRRHYDDYDRRRRYDDDFDRRRRDDDYDDRDDYRPRLREYDRDEDRPRFRDDDPYGPQGRPRQRDDDDRGWKEER